MKVEAFISVLSVDDSAVIVHLYLRFQLMTVLLLCISVLSVDDSAVIVHLYMCFQLMTVLLLCIYI